MVASYGMRNSLEDFGKSWVEGSGLQTTWEEDRELGREFQNIHVGTQKGGSLEFVMQEHVSANTPFSMAAAMGAHVSPQLEDSLRIMSSQHGNINLDKQQVVVNSGDCSASNVGMRGQFDSMGNYRLSMNTWKPPLQQVKSNMSAAHSMNYAVVGGNRVLLPQRIPNKDLQTDMKEFYTSEPAFANPRMLQECRPIGQAYEFVTPNLVASMGSLSSGKPSEMGDQRPQQSQNYLLAPQWKNGFSNESIKPQLVSSIGSLAPGKNSVMGDWHYNQHGSYESSTITKNDLRSTFLEMSNEGVQPYMVAPMGTVASPKVSQLSDGRYKQNQSYQSAIGMKNDMFLEIDNDKQEIQKLQERLHWPANATNLATDGSSCYSTRPTQLVQMQQAQLRSHKHMTSASHTMQMQTNQQYLNGLDHVEGSGTGINGNERFMERPSNVGPYISNNAASRTSSNPINFSNGESSNCQNDKKRSWQSQNINPILCSSLESGIGQQRDRPHENEHRQPTYAYVNQACMQAPRSSFQSADGHQSVSWVGMPGELNPLRTNTRLNFHQAACSIQNVESRRPEVQFHRNEEGVEAEPAPQTPDKSDVVEKAVKDEVDKRFTEVNLLGQEMPGSLESVACCMVPSVQRSSNGSCSLRSGCPSERTEFRNITVGRVIADENETQSRYQEIGFGLKRQKLDTAMSSPANKNGGYGTLDLLVDALEVASGTFEKKQAPIKEKQNVVHNVPIGIATHPNIMHSSSGVDLRELLPKPLDTDCCSESSTASGTYRDKFGKIPTQLGLKVEVETSERPLAPVIRSKRGRPQALPIWLRDSVIQPLKKPAKGPLAEAECSDKSLSVKRPKVLSSNTSIKSSNENVDHNGNEATSYLENGYIVKHEISVPEDSEDDNSVLRYNSVDLLTQDEVTIPDLSSELSTANAKDNLDVTTPVWHNLDEFDVGDLVWAKSGKKNDPLWPAKVIDPIKDAPETVRSRCVPGRLCVMFFGPSPIKGRHRDYAWVKQGMIFPFLDYLDKYQSQTFFKSRPNDFIRAVCEATLVEAGFEDCLDLPEKQEPTRKSCRSVATNEGTPESNSEVLKTQVSTETKSLCTGCGADLSLKSKSKTKNSAAEENSLCNHCIKLYKSKQYCGVCKKVWHFTDKGDWVQCDECEIWVHAECDKISGKHLKELAKGTYYCPDCRKHQKDKVENDDRTEDSYLVPEKLAVVCAGVEAIYLPKEHRIRCKCKKCGGREIMTCSEWEKHTGCRNKKWKESIRVKFLNEPILTWIIFMLNGGAIELAYDGPEAHVQANLRINEIAACLKAPYQSIITTWTSERCAVCRWVEDFDYNKIIICNRCQLAVHEECYGIKASEISGSWVCRVCETPEIERECCLCPVKGGAMKPTSIPNFWIHVTCAWFTPEVTFKDVVAMEPADGIANIPVSRFREVCVVCKQSHGACIPCRKCPTSYHPMCAARAGHHMEINHEAGAKKKNRASETRILTYCAAHKATSPNACIQVTTAQGTLAPTERLEREPHSTDAKPYDVVPSFQLSGRSNYSTAARCRVDNRNTSHERNKKAVPHQVMGYTWHSIEDIDALRDSEEIGQDILEMKTRLTFLQKTENTRVCFGKSAIHGWGLFARRELQEGEMVLEYRGELIRRSVADLREKRYHLMKKDCYFFKISDDIIIDAAAKGNVARLVNHSCSPNMYARIIDVEGGSERIVLIARKTIPAGTELTYNYKFDPEEKRVICRCKAPDCTGYMN